MQMNHLRTALLVTIALFIAGCAPSLVPTPYVMYGEAGRLQFDKVHEALRSAEAPIVYVTDRGIDKETPSGPRYGYRRNPRFTYGVATATLGTDASWDEIVADSTSAKREHTYRPRVDRTQEVGGFSQISALLTPVDGMLRSKPDAVETIQRDTAAFHAFIGKQVRRSGQRDALVFIHGFNNTFDDAVIRMAMAWHLGGRQGIPIVYTWPAGSGGLLGYFFDRESGEFTIIHLKRLIIALATCPDIERIHIVAHSRGTDVATTALRELNSEVRAAAGAGYVARMLNLTQAPKEVAQLSRPAHEVLKIKTLVLAAPDLDIEVFQQRFFGENLLYVAERTVIYVSPADAAIAIAHWLFGSKDRIGTLKAKDLTPQQQETLSRLTNLEIVNCEVTGGSSHAYLAQHPSALSDLILLLRDRAVPGPGGERPLEQKTLGIWHMDNTYLKPESP